MARAEPMPDTAEYAVKQAFEHLGGIQQSASVLHWVHERYPNRWDDRKLRNYMRGCSVNYPKAISYDPHFPRFLYRHGTGRYELYEQEKHGLFDERGYGEAVGDAANAADELRELTEEIESRSEFAYEAHLRDYLARNLNLLEEGLTLWSGGQQGSVEYPLEGKRIDILAKDRHGIPVVIELKLSRGHERTIGQALYYRGKLKKLLQVPRIRIIMVAAEVTDELRIASGEVTDVDIFSYALTMQVQKLDITSSDE